MLAGPWPHRGAPNSHHYVRGPGDGECARQQGARPACTGTLQRPSPTPTLAVAMVTRSTLAWALRSTWWLPEALVKISTPSRPMSTCGLRAEVGQEKGLLHPPTRPPRASPQPKVMTPSPGCLQIPDLLRGSEGGLTCGASRAPRRPHSQGRCPAWPALRLQRVQFPAVGRREHMRPPVIPVWVTY